MTFAERLGLKDDEQVLAVARAMFGTRLLSILIGLGLIAVPFFFMVPLLRYGSPGVVLMIASGVLGLFLTLRAWLLWRGTYMAVTSRRLFVVRRRDLFDRHVIETPFTNIREVSYRTKGPLAMIFGYGTVTVETVGGDKPLELEMIHDPAALKDMIVEQQSGGDRGAGDFGEMLHAVERLDTRKLKMLRAEIERTLALRSGAEEL